LALVDPGRFTRFSGYFIMGGLSCHNARQGVTLTVENFKRALKTPPWLARLQRLWIPEGYSRLEN